MIKGTTKECLGHYFATHGDSSERILGNFVKVGKFATRSWRCKGKFPNGHELLKTRYFLELAGYTVEELNESNCSRPLYLVGQCIALDLISVNDVVAETKLSEPSSFFRYFRERQVAGERLKALQSIAERLEEERKARSAEVSERLAKAIQASGAGTSLPGQDINKSKSVQSEDEKLIDSFAQACESVRNLGQRLLDASVETRRALRRKMNKSGNAQIHNTFEIVHKLMKERKEEK